MFIYNAFVVNRVTNLKQIKSEQDKDWDGGAIRRKIIWRIGYGDEEIFRKEPFISFKNDVITNENLFDAMFFCNFASYQI